MPVSPRGQRRGYWRKSLADQDREPVRPGLHVEIARSSGDKLDEETKERRKVAYRGFMFKFAAHIIRRPCHRIRA